MYNVKFNREQFENLVDSLIAIVKDAEKIKYDVAMDYEDPKYRVVDSDTGILYGFVFDNGYDLFINDIKTCEWLRFDSNKMVVETENSHVREMIVDRNAVKRIRELVDNFLV